VKSKVGNPNHAEAHAIQQNIPEFTKAQHDMATAVQTNVNRAQWGETVHRPQVGTVHIEATGDGTNLLPRGGPDGPVVVATPSLWFEDVKAYYALRAAERPPGWAYDATMGSSRQIDAANVPVIRVPKY
jgi:hypothetical protein